MTKDNVVDWKKGEDGVNLFTNARLNYTRQPISGISGAFDLWQCDLMDVSRWKASNAGVTFILVCIDVFTKYCFVAPVKQKSGPEMVAAFKDVFQQAHSLQYSPEAWIRRKLFPNKIQTDKGNEFKNSLVTKLFRDNEIHWYATEGDTKASMVERLNRTLRMRISRYMRLRNTLEYLGVLKSIVKGYNATRHSVIQLSPIEAQLSDKYDRHIWRTINGVAYRNIKSQECCNGHESDNLNKAGFYVAGTQRRNTVVFNNFKVGDYVRVSRIKQVFEKGYTPTWSFEFFIIRSIKQVPSNIPNNLLTVYELRDLKGENINGLFYAHELQSVRYRLGQVLPIEQVLASRNVPTGIRGKSRKEYLVKWLGWPAKFNSWEREKTIKEPGRLTNPSSQSTNAVLNSREKNVFTT